MTTVTPRRLTAVVATAATAAALAGCGSSDSGSSTTATTADAAASTSASATASSSTSSGGTTTSGYKDGTYQAEGSYQSPGGTESIGVSLTLKGGTVTAVTVTPKASDPNGERYQGEFKDGIGSVVVGRPIDALNVSKVAGSSLTGGGFNAALKTIKADAKS